MKLDGKGPSTVEEGISYWNVPLGEYEFTYVFDGQGYKCRIKIETVDSTVGILNGEVRRGMGVTIVEASTKV